MAVAAEAERLHSEERQTLSEFVLSESPSGQRDGLDCDAVGVDDEAAALELTRQLIGRIVLSGGSASITGLTERLKN